MFLLMGGWLSVQSTQSTQRSAPWQTGQSACNRTLGFSIEDLYPVRSPLVVADFLAEHVRGKRFVEIGTRNGDVLSCVSHAASQVTAIEMDDKYCSKLR